MADMYVYVSEERYNQLLENGFSPSLGKYFHNISVMCMAYDTGNARGAISLSRNTPKFIQIHYNLLKANYMKFLDLGVGPVKKHKGIVSVITVGAISEQLVGWIVTGIDPMFTSPPVVALRTSQYRPFGAKSSVTGLSEIGMLRQAGMYDKAISANARKEVSKAREYAYHTAMGGQIKNSLGQQTETTKLQGSKRPYGDKDIGLLRNIVQDRKREYLANRQEASDLSIMKLG